MTYNSPVITPDSRVKSTQDTLLSRKKQMHLEQKALLYRLRQHLEEAPDTNYRHMVDDIKKGLHSHVDLMEQIKIKHEDLPWAIKTSKHIECQQAVVKLFDNDDDLGAGILQNFFEHDRLTAWAWHEM